MSTTPNQGIETPMVGFGSNNDQIAWDKDIFHDLWEEQEDITRNALLGSGVLVHSDILLEKAKIGSVFTFPAMSVLADPTFQNFDGKQDITDHGRTNSYYVQVVKNALSTSFAADSFTEYLTGKDPMQHIAKHVGKVFLRKENSLLKGKLEAIFDAEGKWPLKNQVERENQAEIQS